MDAYAQASNAPMTPLTLTMTGKWGGGHHPGDTGGFDADADGVFHALWVDNRTGIPQLFTAPITVNGSAAMHGNRSLSTLEDVTQRVTVTVKQLKYDETNHTITADAVLWNRSQEPLTGRLVARVVGLRSDLGDVSILSADNGQAGIGATIDMTSLIPGGRLESKQFLTLKPLRFRLDHVTMPAQKNPPFNAGCDLYLCPDYLVLELVVLGEPRPSSKP
jgi:hypothetical protein